MTKKKYEELNQEIKIDENTKRIRKAMKRIKSFNIETWSFDEELKEDNEEE